MKFIGASLSKINGSLMKTIKTVEENGGNALQLFCSNPRSIELPNIYNYQMISNEITDYCKQNNIKLVIHASYTINLGKKPMNGKKECDIKDCYSVNLLMNQLLVSELLECIGVIVHVGKNENTEQGIINQYNAIKYIISEMKGLQLTSKLILETPAGEGNELLVNVEDFIRFYNMFSADDKKYFKICVDTAHVWSAGYNIEEYYNRLDKKNVIVIHLNNSQKDQGSCVDRHDNIFDGKIPLNNLSKFVKCLQYNPMIILEKPSNNLLNDIKYINEL